MKNNVVSLKQPTNSKPELEFELLSTGFAELDRILPGATWPTAAVTEIISAEGFIDPITLLLPTLATLSTHQRWLTLIAPPQLPTLEDLSEHAIDPGKVQWIHPHREKNLEYS